MPPPARFPAWRSLLPQERSEILRKWFELIVAAKDDLALLMTLEQGKPLQESLGEIDYAASFVEWYAEEAKRLNAESVTSHLPNAEMMVRREPLGVVGVVTPWNFPSAMLTRKAAAALAAGCTIVAHPSSETPLSALALAELGERAGLPAGVFNVVTGKAATIVGRMCDDPRVRAMSFTGSTEIGRLIAAQMRADDEAAGDGAWRPRAADRLRRRRSRQGGRASPSTPSSPRRARIASPPTASMSSARSTSASAPPSPGASRRCRIGNGLDARMSTSAR